MKQKNSLSETLHYLKPAIMLVAIISCFPCIADSSLASGPEDMMCPDSHSFAVPGEAAGTTFLEENGLAIDPYQGITIILPNGEGMELTIIPFSLTKIDSSEALILLQGGDTTGHTIVVSDTCEVIGIIAILLASSCLIYPDPILCTIATVMQGIFRLLCQ